jgi:ATP-dependent RNA helicase RhlE
MTVVPSRSRPLPLEESEVDFASLGLIEPLLRAIRKAGYQKTTPIQANAIPYALAGRDVLGAAQTGTGKTAAFSLPLLQQLAQERPRGDRRPVRALILSPTRELASQIEDCIATYGQCVDIRQTVIFGGVSANNQLRELSHGVDVLVATPGRLWDLLSPRQVDLSHVQVLVLDEVDRMLDQGFWPTVRKIVAKVPKKRQTLAFSATMPDALKPLLDELLVDPVRVSVAKVSSTPQEIEQRVHFVPDPTHKRALLADLVSDESVERVIVFTKTKHGANRVTKHLDSSGIRAEAIHGNKSQNARERALEGFKTGDVRVLVATDIAARGLDIKGISHVVNYDLPVDAESYVHRIGRTARAGSTGVAISLCSHDERPLLVRIERLIGRRVPVAADRPINVRSLPVAEDERPPRERAYVRASLPARDVARPQARAQHDSRRDQRGDHPQNLREPRGAEGHARHERGQPARSEQRELRQREESRGDARGPRERPSVQREDVRGRERPSLRRDDARDVRERPSLQREAARGQRDRERTHESTRTELRPFARDERRETPLAFHDSRPIARARDERREGGERERHDDSRHGERRDGRSQAGSWQGEARARRPEHTVQSAGFQRRNRS